MKKLYVINNSGQKEPFSWKKICNGAERVGASKALAKEIATIIEKEAYPGIKKFFNEWNRFYQKSILRAEFALG